MYVIPRHTPLDLWSREGELDKNGEILNKFVSVGMDGRKCRMGRKRRSGMIKFWGFEWLSAHVT